MSAVEKGWHCRHTLKYYIVWVTKYRYNKFFGQVEKDTEETLRQIATDYDWEIEEMEVMPDPMCISTFPPNQRIDPVMW